MVSAVDAVCREGTTEQNKDDLIFFFGGIQLPAAKPATVPAKQRSRKEVEVRG